MPPAEDEGTSDVMDSGELEALDEYDEGEEDEDLDDDLEGEDDLDGSGVDDDDIEGEDDEDDVSWYEHPKYYQLIRC